MDSVAASEAVDPGSTPGSRTTENMKKVAFTDAFPTMTGNEVQQREKGRRGVPRRNPR